ncbi:MAG: endonuclease domain-containing protein [Chloroflexota bacterium]
MCLETRHFGTGMPNIVGGQKVNEIKVERARGLRREMTAQERVLWQHLRGHRLGGFHFRRQQIIDGFIVDFYCHSRHLVVEVDGSVHENQKEYDIERDRILSSRGLRILRITNKDIQQNLKGVLERILLEANRLYLTVEE